MRAKKLLSVFLAVLLLASTLVVTVMGYDKPYKNGYSYSVKDSKDYVKMEYLHNTAVHVVNTYAKNLTNTQIKAVLAAQTKGKTSDKVKCEDISTRLINSGAKSGVGTSDWRSNSTNVYYWHEVDVFGNTSTSYVVSAVYKTVG